MVMQIGNRLIRTFGEGKNLKRVVTELFDGKIFTNVYDVSNRNKLIRSRVKVFSESNVNGKTIKTKTSVIETPGETYKKVCDRFYKEGSDGNKFLGYRECISSSNDFNFKALSSPNSNFVSATYYMKDGRRNFRYYYKERSDKPFDRVDYNKKGLPYPVRCLGSRREELANASLKDMRNWHIKNYPYLRYMTDELNMGSLDEGLKLNNLDALL